MRLNLPNNPLPLPVPRERAGVRVLRAEKSASKSKRADVSAPSNVLPILALALTLLSASLALAAPPKLFPSSGSQSINPDTQLQITFDSPPTRGSGKIEIVDASNDTVIETINADDQTATQTIGGLPNYKYYPITIEANTVTLHPHNGGLTYGKKYFVKMDAGAFKIGDTASPEIQKPTDWQFATKAASPEVTATRITVAADGSADFSTIQGAIDFIPDGNTTHRTIFIRKGTYNEIIFFEKKNSLSFIGEDRKQTVISYANNAKFNAAPDRKIYHRGVFLANACDDLLISNLTVRDTTPRGGSQAEAIILRGTTTSRAIITNVDLFSYQDTLQINGQAYVSDCYIEGDVDFMWGTGPCFFENCHCTDTRSKAYYTQIRNPPTNHGYVYYHCTFDGPEGVKNVLLSRIEPNRFPASEVVLIDCVLGDAVSDIGWMLQQKADATADTKDIHFWEYNSHHPDGSPVDTSKRLEISRQLKLPDDAETVKSYSDPAFVLGNNWNPRETAKSATQPTTP